MNPQLHNARRRAQHTGWEGRLFWSVQGLRQTPGYQTPTQCTRPASLPACLDKRTHAHAHAYEVHCSEPFLSAPCSRLPGATSGTNKRKSGSIQASHHRRVLCGIVLSLAVVSRPTSMADARRTESGSARSLGPLEPCRPAPPLYLIRFWALSFQPQTPTVPLGARPQTGSANASDHSA